MPTNGHNPKQAARTFKILAFVFMLILLSFIVINIYLQLKK